MSKPVSTATLKKLIVKSDNPTYKINLLLRTLPYHIERESGRTDMNLMVIKSLTNKLLMVRELARKNNIPTYGLIG